MIIFIDWELRLCTNGVVDYPEALTPPLPVSLPILKRLAT